MKNEHKKLDAQFITMVATGEKPDVEIHLAGVCEDDGMNTTALLRGKGGDVVAGVCNIVEHAIETIKKNDGVLGVAAAVAAIGHSISSTAGGDAIKLAAILDMLPNPDELDEVLEELKSKLEDDDE